MLNVKQTAIQLVSVVEPFLYSSRICRSTVRKVCSEAPPITKAIYALRFMTSLFRSASI